MLDCRILTSQEAVMAIENDWHALYERVGTDYFSDYAPFEVWWKTIAQEKEVSLHVVTGWREDHLVALLPLVVCQKKGFRILFWAGYNAFLGSLALVEEVDDLETLWQHIYKSPHYDAAELRYIADGSVLQKAIAVRAFARVIEQDFVTSVKFNGDDGEAWLAGLKRKTRKELRRKINNLKMAGKVSFDVYQKNPPAELLTEMIKYKRDWCVAKGFNSAAFFNDKYIPDLVKAAASRGDLRFFCLRLDDKPISYALGFVRGKIIYTSVVAHDPQAMPFSPGVLVLVEAIKWCADNGLEEFSFMEGREGFKTLYGNNQQIIMTYSFARTLWGHVARALLIFRHTETIRNVMHKLAKDRA